MEQFILTIDFINAGISNGIEMIRHVIGNVVENDRKKSAGIICQEINRQIDWNVIAIITHAKLTLR